ncbi:MAG: nucleotidyltransferase domain-containing protein [Deltaproteobacteria bacterium]|nr:nucleotidyltransferase domain-containing protein [Deltaproteobacteria bacterium]
MTKEINDIAARYGCSFIYLFGSQADAGGEFLDEKTIYAETSRELHSSSDLDIAVAFNEIPSKPDETSANLYRDLSEIFDPFTVDVVFMHEVDSLFNYEIIKGRRIYAKDEDAADEFEDSIVKRASDLYFKKKIYDNEVMGAIENGYFAFEYSPRP